ncbi:glucose 1-dehydrogenase [Pseudobacillus wudalianchiensis]|uniref:Short-chain dehydrogenase n=1 Tax=Pseudobacillus wudalianchiensis TaxID=1743143 RepID=A0A1B9B7B7_9BACI|nr:glucose 1-dehydrogenase [Bacillus wudalianchiensis]OCA92011.1 short-chain dehydrogenase [Bacillus wudalianchiensis]
MGKLAGKVAIITGAAGGQGAYEAQLFTREGAKVIATDVQTELLEQVVARINESGEQAIALKHDVASEEDWQAVVNTTVETYGKVDILINNAGIYISNNVKDTTLDEWDKTMSINSTGVYLGMKHVIPEMLKSGSGSIVNISSIDSIIGSGSSAAYAASKGAVRSLTKNAAFNYAKDKIRVNSVHPGVIITPMNEHQLASEETKTFAQKNTPLPYLGAPEDVAYGVLYLASDESKFVTGIELVIDGGLLTL